MPDSLPAAHRPLYEVKANLFKGLAHPLRIRILEILSTSDEMSVAGLIERTGLEPSHLSQHLAVLRRDHLVAAERRTSLVFYRLASPDVAELLVVARRLLYEILAGTSVQLDAAEDLPAIVSRPA